MKHGRKNAEFLGVFLYLFYVWAMEKVMGIKYNYRMRIREKATPIDLSNLSRKDLEDAYVKLYIECESAKAKTDWYKEQYELSKAKLFGKSSEKNIPGQMCWDDLPLFNEAEALREPLNIEPDLEELVTKTKPKKSKKKNIKSLPVIEERFQLSEEEKICDKCGEILHDMKEEVRLQLEVIPASVRVHKYISHVYACRSCEKTGESNIVIAPGVPAPVIPKSIASPSLIADMIAKKYVDATPFYRQEQNNKRYGIPVTRNNMCNWSIKVANAYFKFVTNRMRELLYQEPVIHCDETHLEVLNEPGRSAHVKSYVWVTTSAEYQKGFKIALYHYSETRSDAEARRILKGYEGYVMCDGYAVYDSIGKRGKKGEDALAIKSVACLVHVRRKFTDALKLLKPENRKGTSSAMAVEKIGKIFHIDNQWNELEYKERYIRRQEQLKPALDDFFAWAEEESLLALPKSKYGQAIEYARNQKEKVMRVLEDGRLELDNSLAERTVKPFVIGRKNWIFANTAGGAEASCILYSIVESAKLNGLIPFEYLKYILEIMPTMKLNEENLDKILPWSQELPSYIKTPCNSMDIVEEK